MDITPLLRPDQKIIQSYKEGRFRVNGDVFASPILVYGSTVEIWLTAGDSPFFPSAVIQALDQKIDILLIGMGNQHHILPPSQRAEWKKVSFTVDFMDTAAACRTYNVLTAEGRRVAAALLPVTL